VRCLVWTQDNKKILWMFDVVVIHKDDGTVKVTTRGDGFMPIPDDKETHVYTQNDGSILCYQPQDQLVKIMRGSTSKGACKIPYMENCVLSNTQVRHHQGLNLWIVYHEAEIKIFKEENGVQSERSIVLKLEKNDFTLDNNEQTVSYLRKSGTPFIFIVDSDLYIVSIGLKRIYKMNLKSVLSTAVTTASNGQKLENSAQMVGYAISFVGVRGAIVSLAYSEYEIVFLSSAREVMCVPLRETEANQNLHKKAVGVVFHGSKDLPAFRR